ncbi:MAG: fibronectin/fibrinogen-binding protein [Chloroflexi bacterium]|nr:fibronectin/fibrinogen-binding protein [Chloroflexota bacterium]
MFDAITLAAVAAELNEKILRGRVQDIAQLDAHAFGVEIYAQHTRRYLYLTAHPQDARVHLVAQKLRARGLPPSPLLLLLRKRVENALLDAITPLQHERVLQLRFDHAREGITTLVVETIGKYANLVLLDADGVVLDALKRVDATINRARVVLPRHVYAPPPPQAKIHPGNLDPSDLARILAANPRALLRHTLVGSIAGVSPLLAREIAFRVTGECDAPNDPRRAVDIVATFHALTRAPWQPCVAFEDDEPAAFAPYPITHSPHHQIFPSISAAIESFYGAPESYAAVKEPLRAQIADARDRLARKRDALADALPSAAEVERLRASGETILAHAHAIARGQGILKIEIGDSGLEIALNPNLSAVENAQKFFKEYHRQKDARARVPALLAAANVEVEYAEQTLTDLELAESRAEIDAVIAAARDAGLIAVAKQRVKTAPSVPREFTSREGFAILVGKNARQNEEVTFRRAKSDDVWLHARNVAGAHVVIVRAGRAISESTIEEAAGLAARYSAARGETRVDVIVAPRKQVQRARGGRAGMVTVRGERTVSVALK